jgi:hypothetical protein
VSGLAPTTVSEINNDVGLLLRQFVHVREGVARRQSWLAANDLKAVPYSMTAADEQNIKTAIANLNTALQAFDMTFINRCTGLF